MFKINIVFFGMNGDFSINTLLKILKYYNITAIFDSLPRDYSEKENLLYKIKTIIKNFMHDSLKKIARKNNIPYFKVKTINTNDMENILKELKPDLICVAGFSLLIKKNIIDIPKYGIINLHPSCLPDYKGPNPWFWMYYNMEEYGGVTIHYIDEGEDSGDIIYQKKYKIDFEINLNDMVRKASEIGSDLMLKAINDIAENNVKAIKQIEPSRITRASRVTNMEEMIDWEKWDVKHIYHFLYGLNDNYHLIKSNIRYKSVQLDGYLECNVANLKYAYGEIYYDKGKYFIPCRDGKIFITYKFDLEKFFN